MNIKRILGISLALTLPLLFPSPAFATQIQSLGGSSVSSQTFVSDPNVTISTNIMTGVHTLGWSGVLSVLKGGTGASSFTGGSLLFYNGSTFAENNSKLFWDNTNNRLGIGTSSPTSTLDVNGTAKVNSLNSVNDSTINGVHVGLGGGSVSDNLAVGGAQVLGNNSTGNYNTAIGESALRNNDGNDNTGLGFESLYYNSTGVGNIGIGRRAGWLQADASTPLTTPRWSIYIGNHTKGYDNNDTNSIVIGDNTTGAGSNSTVIGNTSMGNVYFGSTAANANIHSLTQYSGSSTTPGCMVLGDSDSSGVTYITANDGVLTASTTKPSTCQ